ncbi:MAG: NmrA family NAD(P)-binding protein [Duganella sp.]
MSSNLVLVIGATGKTGKRVAANLAQQGIAVRAVSRHSALCFDWDDAATWAPVLEGVHAVYLVHPGLGFGGATEQVAAFASAAAAAGVKKVVLASTPDDGSEFSQAMRAAEAHIVNAGLGLTSLRLRWFFQNFSEDFLLDPVRSGTLRLPAGDGKEAFVDADDIADVAVAALTDDRHLGRHYDLTGPRALSFADVAQEISNGANHPLSYVAVDADTYIAEQVAQHVPEEWASSLAALYQDIASGKLAQVSGDIETVLGKPARDFSAFVTAAKSGVWR